MTHEEIQKVIDKGGALVSISKKFSSELDEIHWGLSIDGDNIRYEHCSFLNGSTMDLGSGSYSIDGLNWREATPEEVKKHLHEM